MNTTEKIVESYFRICRNCFTMTDVKVHAGNNRQLDLVAFHIQETHQYHVEVGVTHARGFQPTFAKLREKFERKFFGEPKERVGDKTDYTRGKRYFAAVERAYRDIGFSPPDVQRLWVCWQLPKAEGFDE